MTASPAIPSPSPASVQSSYWLGRAAAILAAQFPIVALGTTALALNLSIAPLFGMMASYAAGFAFSALSRLWPASRRGETLTRALVLFGAVLAARSASYPLALIVSAFICGAALAPTAWRTATWPKRRQMSVLFLLMIVPWLVVPFVSAPVAALFAALAAGVSIWWSPRPEAPAHDSLRSVWWPALTVAALVFVGATNPRLSWLGPVTSSGPADRQQVALTFDDGPNSAATDAVLRELAARNTPATFFLVGKAVDREPAMLPRILAAGHLIGDHSYNHDGWRFIQPAYPELGKGEDAILRAANVCPRYYRPPHGTRTPFVWLAARRHEMRLVTWSVSAADWSETDPDRLARRIVERARPGSIILLHDGIDGLPNVDRTVLIAALPQIIDGLRARGLEPVRLDTLLGGEGMRRG